VSPASRIVPAGDSALVVEMEERIDPAINRSIVALARELEGASLPGVRDIVPAYRSLTVYFDPLRTDHTGLMDWLNEALQRSEPMPEQMGRLVEIPVCYGGEYGPDLAEVARFADLSEADVIERHTAPIYQVFMLGFVPGFAYLAAVDPRIAAPRRPEPRPRVVAGSVGVAGEQTGIYPADTPGGWQLIGRTPLKPFDLGRPDPFLLKAGDRVRFHRIVPGEFDRCQGSA
jgi:inhibitor of KinA